MSVHARGHAQIRQLGVTPVADRPGVAAGLGSARRDAGPARPEPRQCVPDRVDLAGAGHRPDTARVGGGCPRRPWSRRAAGIKGEAIRGVRPADMIAAPRRR